MSFKAACIQICATPDIQRDIAVLERLIDEAAGQGAKLIATPEYCAGLKTDGARVHPVAFAEEDHPVIKALAERARAHGAWILIGSIGIRAGDGRIFNRSLLLDPKGLITARYDKIHMFDVDLGEGKSYRESATIAPGGEAVLAPCLGATLGLSICYDLRFAGLYRSLAQAGATLLAVPAAFTKITGEAHWHTLVRARAIENGAYVLAPGQFGTLHGGSQCYGHSLIVDPWGQVLADGGEVEGVIVADIDPELVTLTRGRIPSLKHDRKFTVETA